MENPIKMDDLGVPLFSETSISFFEQQENIFQLSRYVVQCAMVA